MPNDEWDWFALDNVFYRGHTVAVIWDRNGTKFNVGRGLSVFVNGKLAKNLPYLDRIVVRLD